MGIEGLYELLAVEAPNSTKERRLKDYENHIIAFDTSIYICQFMKTKGIGDLENKAGKKTGHLLGLFDRTAAFLQAGIKPVYVFDGTPPDLKVKHKIADRSLKRKEGTDLKALEKLSGHEGTDLKRQRTQSSQQSSVKHEDPCQDADIDEATKAHPKMVVKNNKLFEQQFNECKRLLQLLGVPYVQAPSEAEAQCAHLCKQKRAYAAATEDSDCLTFGAPRVIRSFTLGKKPLKEFNTKHVLEKLGLSPNQFIDFCILCGCDYLNSIKGMDAKKALEIIREHSSIDDFLKTNSSYNLPHDWQNQYKEAQQLFRDPAVDKNVPQLRWTAPDLKGLEQFLEVENDFKNRRLAQVILKINKVREAASTQPSLKNYMTPITPVQQTIVKNLKEEGTSGAPGKNLKEEGTSGAP